MGTYEVESSAVVYDGAWSRVRVDRVRMPGGDVADREIVEQADAVAIVALDADGRVVLVRQYRHAVGGYLLELPAGKLDVDGEAPEAAAVRELAEEVGLAAEHWEPLVEFRNSAGWTTEATRVYLATGLRDVAAPDGFTAAHEEADMEVVRLPLTEAAAMAARGEITDAKTLIGLLVTVGWRRA
ncbi:NUDIX hydrolase [soil metagenome]|jgi:ADP-ribose pyrophosphatase